MTMPHIALLGTGGTMAGERDGVGYRAAQRSVQWLLQSWAQQGGFLPEGVHVRAQQVAQIDSKDMDVATWQAMVRACVQALGTEDAAGVVIVHGSDTLEESACLLRHALAAAQAAGALTPQQAQRPVVLTCAMRPADDARSDGPRNLRDALCVSAHAQARGVLAVCAGRIHSAAHVRKSHPWRLNALESVPAGVLGLVQGHAVRWLRAQPQHESLPFYAALAQGGPVRDWPLWQARLWHAICHSAPERWPWVELLHSHAAAQARAMELLADAGLRALVLVGTGNATLHHALSAAAQALVRRGVRVCVCTRCTAGLPQAAPPVGEGLPVATDIPSHARVGLMLALLQEAAC